MRKAYAMVFACILSCLWLAVPAAGAAEFEHSEVLNWGEGTPATLDPHAIRSTTDTYVNLNLYDALYHYVGNPPKLIPWLATSHTVSDDGLTWTFTLRRGVKFHDGSELTADDVVYSFRRLLALRLAPAAAFWPVLKPGNVVAIGRYDVRFTLDRPFAPFLAALPLVGIVEKKLVEAHVVDGDWAKAWLAANDAGSGPYKAKPGSFHANQSLVLTWFPDYFKPWPQHPIKEVNISTIKEESTLALALLKGEIDGTNTRISPDTANLIRHGTNARVVHDESMQTFQLTMDNERPPFNDIHVRKAISYAFDYNGFINKLLQGTVVRNPGPLPENLWGNPKNLVGYSTDMKKAKAEIAQARAEGVDLSRTLTVYGFTDTQDTRLASELLQSDLRPLGLKVDLKEAYFPTLASMAAHKSTAPDMWFHWVSASFIDPDNWIGEMYDSQFWGTWKASAFYKNSTVDALLRKALVVQDQDQRKALYERASRLIVADAPAVWIYNSVAYRGLSRRVQGYHFTPVGGGSEFRTMTLTR